MSKADDRDARRECVMEICREELPHQFRAAMDNHEGGFWLVFMTIYRAMVEPLEERIAELEKELDNVRTQRG